MHITKRYAKYALLVITLANFLSYCDRQIVSALEIELSHAFNLTEVQFGGLWTWFTVGYMVFAPIVGFLADRAVRTKIFAVCIFLWSLATIGSGLAQSRVELSAARFFIGIGEAGCLVIGPSLIADFFDKKRRGWALSWFFLALPLGGTAGYLLAAGIVTHPHPARHHREGQAITHVGPAASTNADGGADDNATGPALEEDTRIPGVPDWRLAFFVAGIPGIAVGALVWWMMDPPRGGEKTPLHDHMRGFRGYLGLFRNRTLVLIILAQAAAVIIIVPLLHFGVRFFEIKHQMKKLEATLSLGMIALVAGSLGTWASGVLGDRLAKSVRGAYALLAGIAFLFGMPWLLLGFTTKPKWLVLPALTIGAFCYFFCMPAVNTQIANTVSAKQRGMAFALAVFVLHLLGDMSAPLAFGEASRYLGRQTAFVAFSFSMVAAGLLCLAAWWTADADELRAQAEDQAG
jgi:MFS family permease